MRRIDRLWLGRKLMLVVSDVIVFIAVVAVTSSIREPNSLDPNISMLFLPVLCFCIITAYTSGLYELRLVRDFVALLAEPAARRHPAAHDLESLPETATAFGGGFAAGSILGNRSRRPKPELDRSNSYGDSGDASLDAS